MCVFFVGLCAFGVICRAEHCWVSQNIAHSKNLQLTYKLDDIIICVIRV